ncbi:MAG: aminopeptidase [Clostridiales bacterium]|jgi:aminopeptidase|nr:aminopeptidase [Clostridiales bacterium]
MRDIRLEQLAAMLLGHSLRLERGDIVQIRASIEAMPLVKALYRRAAELGLYLLVQWQDEEISRMNYELLDPDREETLRFLRLTGEWELQKCQNVQGYLTIRAQSNDQELREVETRRIEISARAAEQASDCIINHRQWALFYWPTQAQAQKAGSSYERWLDHVLAVSLIDYEKLYQAEQLLAARMEAADKVRISAPGTELDFSIAGLPAVSCYGRRNVPDGEVYTAPVLNSVNGHIAYNVPSNHWGQTYENIVLEFAHGKIVSADCKGDTAKLREIFASDEGASYIGEFSFGVNPLLREPVGNTLFDEKITGSIHFTPGRAYAKADNGNRSSLHWDLIQIQRPEYGGGEIWFDGQLIRRDGLFVPQDLQALNPENLLA